MDLNALAGVVACKHTSESVMTVTAAVDRITLQHPLTSICDLELSGQVTFATGRSSMEISLQVAKAPAEGQFVAEEDILLTCAFTMVPLDPSTKKPVNIAPLLLETEEEHCLYNQGQENYNVKKRLAKTALLDVEPRTTRRATSSTASNCSRWTTTPPLRPTAGSRGDEKALKRVLHG